MGLMAREGLFYHSPRPCTLRDHGHEANASRGVPVYAPAIAVRSHIGMARLS